MEQFLQGLTGAPSENQFELLAFYALSAVAIPLAFGVILDKVIIRSGFLLIGVFGAVSGLFLLLQAQFLALAQVMIYAVAITLVIVIALMLTNPKMESETSTALKVQKFPGAVASVLMFVTIYLALRSQPWNISLAQVQEQSGKWLGFSLLTTYCVPFEFASIMLLAALVGAVMLAKSDPVPGPPGTGEVAETRPQSAASK